MGCNDTPRNSQLHCIITARSFQEFRVFLYPFLGDDTVSKGYKYRKRKVYNGVTIDVKANTEEELGEKYARKKFEIDHALSTTGGNTLVNKWVEFFFDTYMSGSIGDDTLTDRQNMYKNHIRPYIGALRIREVSAGDCQEIVNRMQGYSKDRINKLCQLLFNIFDKARRERMILSNPAEDLTRIPGEDKKRRAATMQEVAMMLLVAKEHRAGLWLRTIWRCGFRPSETDIFRGAHINYEAGLIFIDGTKTASARRIVPASADLLEDFKALDRKSDDLIFQNTQGYQMRKSSRAKLWNSFKREMNIKAGCRVYKNQLQETVIADDLVPYCFRHSFATDLKDANIPYRIRQELLGHSDGSVTDRYTHRSEVSLNTARKLLIEFRIEQDEKIKEIQRNILKNGYDASEKQSEDLTYKYFPKLF